MRHGEDERGVALLMTLLVVALLSVLAIGMQSRSVLALTRARQSVNALTASYIMRSGVSAAMAFLEKDARDSAIDTLSEVWAQEVKAFPVGDGTVSIRIEDEAARFNVNTLVTPQGHVNAAAVQRFGRLLRSVGNDERLSEQTAHWLQTTREPFAYALRDPSELLLVPGFGTEAFRRVEPHVTVSTDRLGGKAININTVGVRVLGALSPRLGEALIGGIIEHRRATPFRDLGDLKKVPGMNDEILIGFSDVLDVRTSLFTVRAEANVGDVVRRGSAVVSREGGVVRIVSWKEE